MKRFILLLVVILLAALPALGQSQFPSPGGTFAGLPASGAGIRVYTVTDCIDAVCAAGGGTAAWVHKSWDGTAWVNSGLPTGGTYAGLPTSGAVIRDYIVTDCLDAICNAGGGSAAWVQKSWDGTAWVNTGLGTSTLDLLTSGSILGQVDVVATTATTDTPTVGEMRGSWHTASNTAVVTYTLPEISTIGVGATACFYDLDDTSIVTIDVDSADVIVLNGIYLDAGDTIDSSGARGDFVCLMAIDSTNWLALGRSGNWVDGGP